MTPRRRGYGRKGRRREVRVTARDVAILGDLTRSAALTLAQLTRRHFGAASTAAHRLDALEDAGYLVHRRPWYRGPGVYTVTPDGARLAGVGLPAARWTRHALAHRLGVADLADALRAAHPAAGGSRRGSCAGTGWPPCGTAATGACWPGPPTHRTARSSCPMDLMGTGMVTWWPWSWS